MVAKRLHNLSCLLPPSLLLDARGSDTKWEMEIGGMRIEKREAPWILRSGNAPKRSGGQVPRARRSRPQGPAREPHRSELLSRKKNAHYTYESASHPLFIGVRCVLAVKKWVNSSPLTSATTAQNLGRLIEIRSNTATLGNTETVPTQIAVVGSLITSR